MNTPNVDLPSYRGYRFPATVISHCVWLYFRFSLSYRDVEEMMAERGVVVSYDLNPVNSEDEDFAHTANGTITAGAYKTARRRRIASHYEFALHRLR